ncbi:hypothetical protein CALVIDRAFT_31307 [Calocera viscosa TUFC12733]|uniref:Secreted protein n=1 Tax=Calocera viscosa (strain TUFC12733) TaxID=1330018 RepID=A0A167PDP4_CALVF|nr:hypothetical protein CALVIDRAFT_31307 [Calocera viscosa TUFC12733]
MIILRAAVQQVAILGRAWACAVSPITRCSRVSPCPVLHLPSRARSVSHDRTSLCWDITSRPLYDASGTQSSIAPPAWQRYINLSPGRLAFPPTTTCQRSR